MPSFTDTHQVYPVQLEQGLGEGPPSTACQPWSHSWFDEITAAIQISFSPSPWCCDSDFLFDSCPGGQHATNSEFRKTCTKHRVGRDRKGCPVSPFKSTVHPKINLAKSEHDLEDDGGGKKWKIRRYQQGSMVALLNKFMVQISWSQVCLMCVPECLVSLASAESLSFPFIAFVSGIECLL